MKSTIAKGIIGNGLAQITQRIIRLLDQLLLVPFFLLIWGEVYYGEWLTLSIIPAVLGFTDLGVGSAASNSFVLAYVAGNRQQAANIRKNGIVVISCTIVLGLVLTALILLICNYLKLFDNIHIQANEAIIAVLLMMAAKLFYFYNQLTEGFFRSVRKAALGAFMYSAYSLMNILVGLCVLFLGYGVVGYAFSQLLVSILYTIIYFVIGNKIINLKEYKGRLNILDIKTILLKGLGYMMNPIWQCIYFQGSTFVVRLILGPESVAVFNTMRTACRSVNQLFNMVNGSILPDLQFEFGRGNMNIVHRMFRLSILTSISFGILGSILLFFFGLDLYNLWTQNTLVVANEVWYAFVLGVLFNGVWWTCIVAYSVTNKPYSFAIVSIITSCISVSVSYLLAIHLSLLGAVIGTTLFDFLMMLYILPNSCGLLGMKTEEIFTRIKEDYSLIKNRYIK